MAIQYKFTENAYVEGIDLDIVNWISNTYKRWTMTVQYRKIILEESSASYILLMKKVANISHESSINKHFWVIIVILLITDTN